MREIPLLPDIYAPVCDVRDVALAHIRAMVNKEAAFKRHLVVTNPKCSSFKDWALVLEKEFKQKGYSIPTRIAPHFFIRLIAYFDDVVKTVSFSFVDLNNLFYNLSINKGLL